MPQTSILGEKPGNTAPIRLDDSAFSFSHGSGKDRATTARTDDLATALFSLDHNNERERIAMDGEGHPNSQLPEELSLDQLVLYNALRTYATLKLEVDFLEVWTLIDKLDSSSRGCVSDLAYKSFGRDAAHRMARIVTMSLDSVEAARIAYER